MIPATEQKPFEGVKKMKNRQRGAVSLRPVLLVALAGLAVVFAVSKYNDLVEQTRVNEAFHLASESRIRLTEFYLLSDRFPTTAPETEAVTTDIFTVPEFVSDVVVEQGGPDYEIMVKIILKEDVVKNRSGGEQFIYMAANKPLDSDTDLQWNCGASGVEDGLLPADCKG
jgi:hypothetical protein